jgi:hypothetical protein
VVAGDPRGRLVGVQAAAAGADVRGEPDAVLPVLADVADRVERVSEAAGDLAGPDLAARLPELPGDFAAAESFPGLLALGVEDVGRRRS